MFNEVAAVDERSGRRLWQWISGDGIITTTGSDETAIAGLAHDGRFYESVPATSEFIAFDAASGRVVWRVKTAADVKMSAVEDRGRLYFGDTGGTFYVVRASDGGVLERRRFPSYFTTSSPVIYGDTLFIANNRSVEAIPVTIP